MSSDDGGGGVAESAAAHPGDAGGPGQGEEVPRLRRDDPHPLRNAPRPRARDQGMSK